MISHLKRKWYVILFCSLALCVGNDAGAEIGTIPDIGKVNPVHPRVLISPKQEAETVALLKTDTDLQALYASVEAEAKKLLEEPKTVEYIIVGPRLLTQSRRCLRRVLALGSVYRLTEDDALKNACRERAMREIRAAAAFPDWNPSHFLDTAEMTAAFAVAFDWFYADLNDADKKLMIDAIYEKGLVPGAKNLWWKRSAYNWNQVCTGGMAMGALAIADEVKEPEKRELIQKTVQEGVKNVAVAMKSFSPDGAWAEGPAYWCYTTLYTIFYIEALESALGSDFGVSDVEGFNMTAASQLALTSPTGISFNFADAGAGNNANSQLMWLANRYGHPEWTQFYLKYRKDVYPTAVWYYRPALCDMSKVPCDFVFRGTEIATFRSAWNDPDAWYVGFKAGDNAVNHSHLELGNFILERNQVRWAVDLGADNYNLPGYFGKLRWTYYRLATRGQNTFCIDGMNQDPKGVSKIDGFQTDSECGYAWTNLSDAYKGQVAYIRRKVELNREKSCVVITDIIGPGTEETRGKSLVWQFHTRAKAEVAEDGKSVTLTQNVGKETRKLTIFLENATNQTARFELRETTQGPDENQNAGVQRVVISTPITDAEQFIVVKFTD